jgi:hypothetical protein
MQKKAGEDYIIQMQTVMMEGKRISADQNLNR